MVLFLKSKVFLKDKGCYSIQNNDKGCWGIEEGETETENFLR